MADSVGAGPEGMGDLQNYLADFNPNPKDPVISKAEPMLDTGAVDDDEEDDTGQYFVDQATGQYYFQSSNGDMVQVMEDGEVGGDTGVGPPPSLMDTGETEPGQLDPAGDLNQVMGGHLVSKQDPDLPSNQVIMAGGDQYQTVTIVPNQENNGELSYVLIVQNDGEKKGAMGEVYDFETENDPDYEDGEEVDEKTKMKYKQTSQVAASFTCNYCNYSTPKRYLLSRHMKSHSDDRPHKCSVCERGFKTQASLLNHVNTHTGTKPHQCKYCQVILACHWSILLILVYHWSGELYYERGAGASCSLQTHTREAAQVSGLRLHVGGAQQAQEAHAVSHGRAAIPVPPLHLRQPRHLQTQETSENPYW